MIVSRAVAKSFEEIAFFIVFSSIVVSLTLPFSSSVATASSISFGVTSTFTSSALDTIKLNLATIVAKQLFDKLETADGNIVKISPDEGIAYIGGKFYDVFYKDGNLAKMEAIDDGVALAKLTKFAEDTVGNFVTLNKDVIEQLLENNENLQSIEYELTNKLFGDNRR